MSAPQLRSRIAELDKELDEERLHNPFVAVLEESLQDVLNPDDIAEVLLQPLLAGMSDKLRGSLIWPPDIAGRYSRQCMQALLAAVSASDAPLQQTQTADFPAVLTEAFELSRRCAAGAGESVAALKGALACCDAADIAAQTTVDTPLLLNSLLAAAQGIPVAEVRACMACSTLLMAHLTWQSFVWWR